jgi:hypothetical protein
MPDRHRPFGENGLATPADAIEKTAMFRDWPKMY